MQVFFTFFSKLVNVFFTKARTVEENFNEMFQFEYCGLDHEILSIRGEVANSSEVVFTKLLNAQP